MNAADMWSTHFGDLPAVGYLMREVLHERWLRIHSLRKSKRYAETKGQYAELLRRQNAAAAEILGNQECALLAHLRGSAAEFAEMLGEFPWARRLHLHEAVPSRVCISDDEEDDLCVGGCTLFWSQGGWDDMIRDVADDRAPSIVLLNPRSGEVYAPYDGGADLFVTDPERVGALKRRWAAWLSTHPEGL